MKWLSFFSAMLIPLSLCAFEPADNTSVRVTVTARDVAEIAAVDAVIEYLLCADDPYHRLCEYESKERFSYAIDIVRAAKRYHISPFLLAALIKRESGYNPEAVGKRGEIGLTQILRGVASEGCDLSTTRGQIECGAKYFRSCIDYCPGNQTVLSGFIVYASGKCEVGPITTAAMQSRVEMADQLESQARKMFAE